MRCRLAATSIFPGVTDLPDSQRLPRYSSANYEYYNVYSVNQNFRTPYFYNFNLQVEKSLGSAAVLQIGYVGSEGRKLSVFLNLINYNRADHATTGSDSTQTSDLLCSSTA